MNSIMSNIKHAASNTSTGDDLKSKPDQPSNTDLMSSAKLVAEAAQCAATNQTDKIDKQKVAGATADLLDSVKQYGKFDESQGVGQYIKQGEDYLHQYEKSGGVGIATPPVEAPPAIEEKEIETVKPEEAEKKYMVPAPAEEKKDVVPAPAEEKKGGLGAEDAFKAAGSFLK